MSGKPNPLFLVLTFIAALVWSLIHPHDYLTWFLDGFPALCISVALSVSLIYELIEWGVSQVLSSEADSFLGTQGDIWDTQSDMGFAFLGALLGLILLSRVHDSYLSRMGRRTQGV
jgi:uncharacterized membrane protein YjdF